MQPYFLKLENGREEALTQWDEAKKILEKQKDKGKIFKQIFEELINVITKETFPNGKLSEATENALINFREMLLPKQAIVLNKYFDIDQILIAAYQAYDQAYNDSKWENWAHSSVFCIKVIGFIQSLGSPELARMFIQGLYIVVANINQKMSHRAVSLKLYRIEDFYKLGLGSEFFYPHSGCRRLKHTAWPGDHVDNGQLLEIINKAKTKKFNRLKNQLLKQQKSTAQKRCLIC